MPSIENRSSTIAEIGCAGGHGLFDDVLDVSEGRTGDPARGF